MKKLIILVLVLSAVACTTEKPEVVITKLTEQTLTITATYGEPGSKTERTGNGSVLWSPGDQISLFYGSGTEGGSCFTAQNTEVAPTANFTGTLGVITGGNDVTLEDTFFWATYPYCASASCNGSSITTVLPATQVATADTFADDLFPTIGRSQGLSIAFYSICGGLKFTVSEPGITSVTLRGNNNEVIAGTMTVSMDNNGIPVVTSITEGGTAATVAASNNETLQVGHAYYIVIVPTVFENGFSLTFTKENSQAIYNRSARTTIRRSAFGSLTTPDTNLEWEQLYVNIPDPNFRAYMIEHFDTNGNEKLDISEAETVTEIDIRTDDIASVSGIEYCTNLQRLTCCGPIGNVGTGLLDALDVSANTALTYLDCGFNQLTYIDLSVNTSLTDLSCNHNKLTSLDISNNTSLAYLYCEGNQLTALDVSNNTALTLLYCDCNQLTSLDLSNSIELTDLSCANNQLTSLNLNTNTALTSLECSRNQLSSLNVSAKTAMTYLDCMNNQLTTIDISGSTALTDLLCNDNKLCSLDISTNTELEMLYCYGNLLSSLNVSTNLKLESLKCSPMNDAQDNNLLGYLYIAKGQTIPGVTENRSTNRIPEATIIQEVE